MAQRRHLDTVQPILSVSSSDPAPPSRRLFWQLNALVFVILGGYGITAPASQSLFLEDYGSDALPHAWLGVTIAMVPCVVWVNHLSTRLPLEKVFVGASLASCATLVALLSARAAQVPHASFLLFLWKEIYIVILVELFWTYANVAFATHYAQRFYGWFCASGTVGGIVGNFATGYFAKAVGTVALLWISVPTLLLTAVCALATRQAPDHQVDRTKKPPSLRDSLALLRRSSYVGWLVLLVGVVQTSITLMDFQFNEVIAASYSDLDARTQVVSYVQAAINVGSLVLQMGTGLILRAIGLPATLLVIPLTLLTSLVAFVAVPTFWPMTIAKVWGKSADYSVFRAAKEMLYIPLGYAEKTQGKALVDMLVYRVAKGGVSLLLMVLVGMRHTAWIGGFNCLLTLAWFCITFRLLALYSERMKAG